MEGSASSQLDDVCLVEGVGGGGVILPYTSYVRI